MLNLLLSVLIILLLYKLNHQRSHQRGGSMAEFNQQTIIAVAIAVIVVLIILYLVNKKSDESQPATSVVVGGCQGTQYGCCPDGRTPRADYFGTNCYYQVPPTVYIQGYPSPHPPHPRYPIPPPPHPPIRTPPPPPVGSSHPPPPPPPHH